MYAFISCINLADIRIPNSVERIARGAFEKCVGLREVVVGSSVKEIAGNAFRNCSALTEIEFRGAVPEIDAGAFYGVELENLRIYLSGDAAEDCEEYTKRLAKCFRITAEEMLARIEIR